MSQPQNRILVTEDLILAGMSGNGGWKREQLEILGVGWPPRLGWKMRVLGTYISLKDAERFVELSNTRSRKAISRALRKQRELEGAELAYMANLQKDFGF